MKSGSWCEAKYKFKNALTYFIATFSVRGNGGKMADQQVVLINSVEDETKENVANDNDRLALEISRSPTKFRLV